MKVRARPEIAGIFADRSAVERVLVEAVREAIRRHKHLDEPVFVWRDGQVVRVAPEEIPEQ